MTRSYRLIFLLLSLILLIVIGRISSTSFSFLIGQFWFTAGLLLLVLLSIIDQPFFSKDANVFVNGTTAAISMLIVVPNERDLIWKLFIIWAIYLVVSSYILMWIRGRPLVHEHPLIQFVSRINRQIGRPEAIFSALFLWGCSIQYATQRAQFNALFLYWAVFMILNLPAVGIAINSLLTARSISSVARRGKLIGIISPRIAVAEIPHDLTYSLGNNATIYASTTSRAASGVVIDDRFVSGLRTIRIGITDHLANWQQLADPSVHATVEICQDNSVEAPSNPPISVVDTGSDIGSLVVRVHPDCDLSEGELLSTTLPGDICAYYQIVSAIVSQDNLEKGNSFHSVRVSAGQIGIWDPSQFRFEPVTWVPSAGALVRPASDCGVCSSEMPKGHSLIGHIPNSTFPVHVNISDIVTHNTALIGVTGSGKSYLTFHMIEQIVAQSIKVLILDISRQHFNYLSDMNPTPLKDVSSVDKWIDDPTQLVGIHQYATSTSYPQTTADFVAAAFDKLSTVTLRPGKDEPAKLVVILEEAHSLIPEWNQVADQSDPRHVNRTARTILQGRKYGMGCIIITQRTANVTKTMLNQCNTIIALQSFDQTGLDFLKNYMGEKYAHAISTLPTRHAIIVGKASSSTRPLILGLLDLSDRWKASSSESEEAINHEVK